MDVLFRILLALRLVWEISFFLIKVSIYKLLAAPLQFYIGIWFISTIVALGILLARYNNANMSVLETYFSRLNKNQKELINKLNKYETGLAKQPKHQDLLLNAGLISCELGIEEKCQNYTLRADELNVKIK